MAQEGASRKARAAARPRRSLFQVLGRLSEALLFGFLRGKRV